MNVVRRVIEIMAERAIALIGSLFATCLETIVTLETIEHHNAMEDRARELEQQGKPQLAEALRARAGRISPDGLAAHGLCILRRLDKEQQESSSRQLIGDRATAEGHASPDKTSDESRGCTSQPETRRLRRPQAAQ